MHTATNTYYNNNTPSLSLSDTPYFSEVNPKFTSNINSYISAFYKTSNNTIIHTFQSSDNDIAKFRSASQSSCNNPASRINALRTSDNNPAPRRNTLRASDNNPAPCRNTFRASDNNPAPRRNTFRASDSNPAPHYSHFSIIEATYALFNNEKTDRKTVRREHILIKYQSNKIF